MFLIHCLFLLHTFSAVGLFILKTGIFRELFFWFWKIWGELNVDCFDRKEVLGAPAPHFQQPPSPIHFRFYPDFLTFNVPVPTTYYSHLNIQSYWIEIESSYQISWSLFWPIRPSYQNFLLRHIPQPTVLKVLLQERMHYKIVFSSI